MWDQWTEMVEFFTDFGHAVMFFVAFLMVVAGVYLMGLWLLKR